MTTNAESKSHKTWICALARVLAVIWGSFWALFGLLSGLGESTEPLGVLFHMTVPGFVFLATVIVAWSHEKTGGMVLMVEGLLVGVAYPLMFSAMATSTIVFVLLAMALPPVVAGVLFMLDSRKHHPVASV